MLGFFFFRRVQFILVINSLLFFTYLELLPRRHSLGDQCKLRQVINMDRVGSLSVEHVVDSPVAHLPLFMSLRRLWV